MFAKAARGRIWTLIGLGLLLAGLVPPAAPAYAEFPHQDARVRPVAERTAASSGERNGATRGPTDGETPWDNSVTGGGGGGQSSSRGNSCLLYTSPSPRD